MMFTAGGSIYLYTFYYQSGWQCYDGKHTEDVCRVFRGGHSLGFLMDIVQVKNQCGFSTSICAHTDK